MARGKGRSGRRYVRDAKGRFASKGFSGQTGGRGARLKSAGKKREGGGEKTKITAISSKGTLKAKPRSAGQKYAARIQAGKDLKRSQSVAEQKKFFAQTQKKLDAAPLAQSSARQAATDRLKIKTATKRKLKTDRSSVIPATPKARRVQGSRPASTVAKPRTKGNDPRTVARRVDRKTAVNQANIKNITRAERTGATQGRQYQRALKTQATLKRAQEFTKTGKLPGRNNSIKAQRERKAASQRLAAKRAARQRGDTASVNVPMRGSRGRALNAEISRNVAQQKAAKRSADKARNRQFKSDQSRAKKLREVHVPAIAKAKGLSKSQVESAFKAQSPSTQVKALKNWVKQNRKAKPAPAARQSAAKRAAANKVSASPAKSRRQRTVSTDKVERIAERLNKVATTKGGREGIKALNRIEVAVRAKSFLSRKAGGVSGLNSMGDKAAKLKSVKSSIDTRRKYSTQKSNRNKPGKFNDLGQSKLRAQNKAAQAKPASVNLGKPAQVTSRGRTIKPAENFKPAVKGKSAPDNARTRANKLKTAQNKVRMYSETDSRSAQNAIANRNAALKARPQGTPGKVIFRSKNRASSRFQQRANDLTSRIKGDLKINKPGAFSATGGGGGRGIVRRNTGDKQTSMFGKPAPLYTNKTAKSVKRRSGKRK